MKLIHGDCLEVMAALPGASVDLILCDLPYGTTGCSWDSIIPFDSLWEQYRRLIRNNGAIVLTASQPFASALVMSAIDLFKYEWIWEKNRATGHVHAKNKPLKKHESVLVFSKGAAAHASLSNRRMPYNPLGIHAAENPRSRKGRWVSGISSARPSHKDTTIDITGYPTSILEVACVNHPDHPTQKPVALMEYFIRTYTSPGDVVLDNCMGSGTTGVAAIQSGRQFIGIERDAKYFQIAQSRIQSALPDLLQAAE